jgi:hypothetical protein
MNPLVSRVTLVAALVAQVACGPKAAPTNPAPAGSAATAPATGGKMRTCPDAWIENRMPSTDPGATPREYVKFGDKTVSLDEVDVDWVKQNCPIKGPQVVQ